MQLSHLEYLVAVKDYGSMNKAAAALFCAQPTISNAFQSLEKELDCKIIQRTVAGVSFTEEGEQIVSDARVILGMIYGWKRISQESKTEFEILFSSSSGKPPMLDVLFEYQRVNPEVKFKLVPSLLHGAEMLRCDKSQQRRFGFFSHTPDELPETKKVASHLGMKIARISRGCFNLCFSPDNPLSKKERIYTRDIAGMQVILKDGVVGFPYIRQLQELHCDCSMAMGDHTNIMVALLNNPNAVSFRPEANLENDAYISAGLINARRLENFEMEINKYIFYPEYTRMNSEERKLIDYIRTHARMFEPV
jgi:DNA-binding transcriptional LysR family regulator